MPALEPGLRVMSTLADSPGLSGAGGALVVELGDRAQGLQFAALLADAGLPDASVTPIQGGPTSMVVARRR